MGLDANKDLIRRFLRALGEGRLDDAAKLVAEDARFWILGVGDRDIQIVKEGWSLMFSSAPGPDSLKIVGMTAEGDRVAAEMVSNLKLPDGRDFRNSFHMLYVIGDGRIVEVKEYCDTAYAAKMVGASSSWPDEHATASAGVA